MLGISFPQFSFRHAFERFQNAVGAGVHRNRRKITPYNFSIFIDNKERALSNPLLVAIRPILLRDRTLRLKIRQQRKMIVAILGERLVAPDAVDGNAQQLGMKLLELRKKFVVQTHLVAADGTPVGGIKRQNHGLTAKLAQGQSLIGRHMKSEIRSWRSSR